MIKKTKIAMKSLLSNKRSKALLGIGLIAIGIGAISKKVISYPTGDCIKGNQELTLNKGINKLFNWQVRVSFNLFNHKVFTPPYPISERQNR